jgi:rod shape determining protein RodA
VQRQRRLDVPLLVLAALLTALGVAMVFSAGQTDAPAGFVAGAWRRQLAFAGAALLAAWLAVRTSVRVVEWATPVLYGGSLVLLLAVLAFGTGAGTAASVKGWLTIGGVRVGQPAELAKVATVLMLAKVLAARREPPRVLAELWRPLLVVGVPWVLVMAQPDLGTGIAFIGVCFALLFWAGVPPWMLLMLASPGIGLLLAFNSGLWGAWFVAVAVLLFSLRRTIGEAVTVLAANVALGVVAPVLWDALKPYQRQRLLVFLDPGLSPGAAGYQVTQSRVAIGSGGMLGKGFTLGTQKRLGYLPERHTDFIFSVVGEELGFIGVTLILTLFLALLLRILRVATRASDSFAGLVALGLGSVWLVHIVVNVGMTLGLMPVTGIPLPFLSYGPSFLVVSWLAVGVLLRISSEGRGEAGALGF